jgi:hypothetical protein
VERASTTQGNGRTGPTAEFPTLDRPRSLTLLSVEAKGTSHFGKKFCNIEPPLTTYSSFGSNGPLMRHVASASLRGIRMWELDRVGITKKGETGASLVEFAIVLPFLLVLLLGIVEFGWVLGQMNDIRHGAREAARLAAVDTGSATLMRSLVCSSMDLGSGQTVTFTDSANGAVGEEAVVTVSLPVQSLTGASLITSLLPSSLTSTVRARLEQPSASWSTETGACP